VKGNLDKETGIIVDEEPNNNKNSLTLKSLLESSSHEITDPFPKCNCDDVMMYIYTSGTTGLPKPAIIRHNRAVGAGFTFTSSASVNENDVLYLALPIYHASGALIGIGSAFVSGVTVVLKSKFSASSFWKDVVKYKCTAFVYVGEICRFLVNSPVVPEEKEHKIRVALGNGLRMNIWKQFDERFKIKCVEFYASSEGNCTFCKN
jgi:acyl-CoA synthetase (AMP-forming)/AMP-acid ligase II